MRRRPTGALAVLAALALPAGAGAQGHGDHGAGAGAPSGPAIAMGFADFGPTHLDVLAGETVTWTNDSARRHTVTSADGAWDSGDVVVGDAFARRFDDPGAVAYHCRLHAGMNGEVVVHRILLDPQPLPAAPGRAFPLTGRAALPAGTAVTIEADEGAGYTLAGTAVVGADGTFVSTVVPRTTAAYRAVAAEVRSEALDLLVLDRTVTATSVPRRRGATVQAVVTPAAPGARVVLQLRLRDRFGWWPVERARLDARGRARFTTPLGSARAARVVLVLPDGATVLAASRTLTVGPLGASRRSS